jgi:hypothetical protein
MLKNHGVYWDAAATIKADVGLTLVALREQMAKHKWRGGPHEWTEKLRANEDEKEAQMVKKMAVKPCDGHLNPLVLLEAMNKVCF